MRCDRFREAASARLDGEPLGMSASGLNHHLATCADCARWAEDATRLTRQARLTATMVPDLSDRITADVVLPAGRVLRRRLLLRAALALAGIVQSAIALPAFFGESIGMAMSAHATHEAAAWNLALAAAFLATAATPRRAAGLVPLLATFVVVLAALSLRDYAAEMVSTVRISTHLSAIGGLVLVLLLDRAERASPPGRFTPAGRADRAGDRDRDGERDGDGDGHERGRRRLRGVA
jgi:predicted anti-sigma-YlaC factor YlaD